MKGHINLLLFLFFAITFCPSKSTAQKPANTSIEKRFIILDIIMAAPQTIHDCDCPRDGDFFPSFSATPLSDVPPQVASSFASKFIIFLDAEGTGIYNFDIAPVYSAYFTPGILDGETVYYLHPQCVGHYDDDRPIPFHGGSITFGSNGEISLDINPGYSFGFIICEKNLDHVIFEKNLQLGQSIIYPNPAYNTINIESQFLTTDLMIFNQTGNIIFQQSIEKKDFTQEINSIDISSIPSGVYFLHLQNEEKREVQKFIKL